MDLARICLLAVLLATPLTTPRAQLSSPASIVLTVSVPPRLSLRAERAPRVEMRSNNEIEVVAEIEVLGNTRYRASVRSARRPDGNSAADGVRVAVRNASGALEPLEGASALLVVTDGHRSGRHEVRCVVHADDPALVQPNRCALVFEVTSVDGERLLRAAAVLDLEDALLIRPRPSETGPGERQ